MKFSSSLFRLIMATFILSLSVYILQKKITSLQSNSLSLEKDLQRRRHALKALQFLNTNPHKIQQYFKELNKIKFFKAHTPQKLKIILDEYCEKKYIDSIYYTIGPTEKKNDLSFPYYMTRLQFDLRHFHDLGILQFLQILSEDFPGMLIPEQLALSRSDESGFKGVSGFYYCYLITLEGEG